MESSDLTNRVRNDFPVLRRKINGQSLIWFDNGATTQKPNCVINYMKQYDETTYANVHRSPHSLSKKSSELFDNTRLLVSQYINSDVNEIIFTKGATESLNLVINSFAYDLIDNSNVDILITEVEHHANIVPWHILQKKLHFNLKYISPNNDGSFDLEELENIFIKYPKIKIFSVTHISNVLGIVNPIKEMCKIAHKYNVYVIIDGAQGIPHMKIDVKDIDCDFYAFSSHKLFGPSGVGILFGKSSHLNNMPVWQGGGSMIENVTMKYSTYLPPPLKFEAGTPPITSIIGLGNTINYLNTLNHSELVSHEKFLTIYLYKKLNSIPNIFILGNTIHNKIPIFSFTIKNINMNDLVKYLDQHNIATRYGHHCAQPIINKYNQTEVLRVSLAFYNTKSEINYFIDIVRKFIKKNISI